MINKYSDVPLYVQLKNIIADKIESGEYRENCQIPSEQELCELYSISRPTVRQAISELTATGYLRKEKGRGTFVLSRKASEDIRNFSGFSYSLLENEFSSGRDIISIKESGPECMKCLWDAFGNPADPVGSFWEVKHVVSKNEGVICFNVSYVPISIFPNLADDLKQNKPTYEIMKNKYPYVPVKSKTIIEIVCSESSDSHILQLQLGQPVLRAQSVLYSKNGYAVEYSISKFRMDRSRLVYEYGK